MKIFGLIGKALSHSLSQQFFTEKFLQNGIADAEYQLFSLPNIDAVKALLKRDDLLGFNVTIPYKTAIIPFLDELDPVAQAIGAVNCVVKQNYKWVGYNMDGIGFEKTLQEAEGRKGEKEKGNQSSSHHLIFKSSHHLPHTAYHTPHTLVLGSGGASKAVCYVLKQKGIPYQIVSRNKTADTITYHEVTNSLINHSSLIINTTPLGMFPNTGEMPPIPYDAIGNRHTLIDLIYNPEETLFLKEGKKRSAFTVNGMSMFLAQAEASYFLFNE
jgi:shikimate dehydrogenase